MTKIKNLLHADLSSVIVPLIVLGIILSITSSGFLSYYNIYSNLQTISIYVIAGLAQMTVLALGQMNLAVGSIGVLSGVVLGYTMQVMNLPVGISIVITCAAGLLFGMVQGLLIAKSGINPFIISLALLSVYKGLALIITKGEPYKKLPDAFRTLSKVKILNLPFTIYVVFIVCGIVFVMFRYRKIGKQLLACGANGRAATFSGINYAKTVVIGHCTSGLLCAIAAILQISRFGSAQLSVGDDWMLTSCVVPVLGGTLLSGGKVTVIGTFLGGVLMVMINNAIVLWGVSSYASQTAIGIILLAAYEVDRMRRNMMQKQARSAVEQKEDK